MYNAWNGGGMRITAIETHTCWISWCNWLFVRVVTDEGLYGWGEGSLHGSIAAVERAVRELGESLIGEDPAGVERHWQRMYHAWRWRGGPVLMTALGALDIALWDIEGKRLGVPVYRLLGGPFRDRLRVYASHWLGGADTPEAIEDGVKDALARGFTALKWSPFNRASLRRDERAAIRRATELMAAARAAAGPDVEIFVECGELLSPRTAVAAARAFAPYQPGWFEEPIGFENRGEMCRLQKILPVPIATGERLLSRWDVEPLLAGRGCDVLQPDVMHAGGITETRRMAMLADTHYVSVAPHNPGGPVCNLAAMHLAASIPNFLILEQMEEERELRDRLCTSPVRYGDGYFELPTTPGIGTDLDLAALDAGYQPQPQSDSSDSLWH